MYSPTSLNQYKVKRLIDSKNNEVQTNQKPRSRLRLRWIRWWIGRILQTST